MEPTFWIEAWTQGRTAFHKDAVHPKLIEFFPRLGARANQRILVPLCGKSKDMHWLFQQGLAVHGVELYAPAAEAFFVENHIQPVETIQTKNFANLSHQHLMISIGDFFELRKSDVYDFVYDRAALVALPEPMRRQYAQSVKRLVKKHAKILLIAMQYDQTKLEGPPFSVTESHVRQLYDDQFTIELLDSQPLKEEGRLASLDALCENVYLLEKK